MSARKTNPMAAALWAARDRHSSASSRSPRRPATEAFSLSAQIIRQCQPAGPPGRNNAGDDGGDENPNRGQSKIRPRKCEMNRPAKEGAIDYAGQDQRQAETANDADNRRQQTEHRRFRQ